MLSKQDYEMLAKTIGDSKNLSELTIALLSRLKQDNPNFDGAKFLEAINSARKRRLYGKLTN